MKLFIAIPAYKDVSPETVRCLLDLTHCGFQTIVDIHTGCSLISSARAELTRRFLASDATHMLFLDSDVSIQSKDFHRWLGLGKPFIAGVYVARMTNKPLFNAYRGIAPVVALNSDSIIQVHSTGLGATLIEKDALGGVLNKHAADSYKNTNGEWCPGIFNTKIGKNYITGETSFLGEDYMFFHRVQEAQFMVFSPIDTTIRHAGVDFCLRALFPKQVPTEKTTIEGSAPSIIPDGYRDG